MKPTLHALRVQDEQDENKIALFDMDMTLFDYVGKLRADLQKLAAPEEPSLEDIWDERLPHISARMNLIKSVPGWWLNLPKLQAGWDILGVAKKVGFKTQILTKGPWKKGPVEENELTKSLAWMEKVDCIRRHFPDGDMTITIVGETKKNTFGRVLCDDYSEYVMDWLGKRKRGLAIMPAHDYNKECKHPNVIRYDGTNLAEIEAAMKAAYDRKDGQHWKDLL